MSFVTPSTPTKSKPSSSSQQVPVAASHHNMDDINMLLYLEALKKKLENENAITQKVEESYKTYQKRRLEYFNLYSTYVKLVKKASTRKVLLKGEQTQLDLATASVDIECVKEKLINDYANDYIDAQQLEKFKLILKKLKQNPEDIKNLRQELTELKNATKDIQSSIESIEVAIDNGTSQGLVLFMDELDMGNFPKICKENSSEDM